MAASEDVMNRYLGSDQATTVFSRQRLTSPYSVVDVSSQLSSYGAPRWLRQAKAQLDSFANLEPGWDSYGAKQISASSRSAAYEVLSQVARLTTPPPSLVPTSNGSVQIEWHTKDVDLELQVLSGTRIAVTFEDLREEAAPIDEEMQYDFTSLKRIINILSAR